MKPLAHLAPKDVVRQRDAKFHRMVAESWEAVRRRCGAGCAACLSAVRCGTVHTHATGI